MGNSAKKNNTTHFRCLSKYNVTSTKKYAKAISALKLQFNSMFLDFKVNENFFNLFSIPFSLSVKDIPDNMQMEIIDLQNNKILKEKYNIVQFSIFYSKYIDPETYLNLRNNSLRSLFLAVLTLVKIFFHE
jgi:hypothetical protein